MTVVGGYMPLCDRTYNIRKTTSGAGGLVSSERSSLDFFDDALATIEIEREKGGRLFPLQRTLKLCTNGPQCIDIELQAWRRNGSDHD
jgi:hypothetical protein